MKRKTLALLALLNLYSPACKQVESSIQIFERCETPQLATDRVYPVKEEEIEFCDMGQVDLSKQDITRPYSDAYSKLSQKQQKENDRKLSKFIVNYLENDARFKNYLNTKKKAYGLEGDLDIQVTPAPPNRPILNNSGDYFEADSFYMRDHNILQAGRTPRKNYFGKSIPDLQARVEKADSLRSETLRNDYDGVVDVLYSDGNSETAYISIDKI